ncbi:SGNH/GDSL hydrolase family protein [Pontibacter cellulosilyticus]|uniref:SGNH/GDSL hydrolase family protein n=1 Tax=Pontibacter cellulosilyticus TaxID=1720253 RepID=A0A923N9P2_9BACT|nr:SGNH/GDSL hydrolase family protein [Pontibacter cellulosilyticus]MBC5993931.1 SGNH/GDSL hydrolase family protein [Pontibacter cellulosilyticus]
MKKFFYKSSVLALAAGVLLTSCDPEIDSPDPSSGTADFSSYLAVGNSLSAGYADGGLYREGQLSSVPAILADQFEEVGGGEFVQPLFSEAQANGTGYLRLVGFTPQGAPITQPVTTNLAIRGLTSRNTPLYTKFTGNINNLAIPGIRVADINTGGYSSAQGNPYFERLTDNATQTYLQYVQAQAQAANHTFFSLWMAENDVLSYATSGGAFSGGMLNSPAQIITPVNTFSQNYTELVNALTAGGKEGVLVTIPDVTAIPFFTTVGNSVKQLLAANKIPAVVALTGSGSSRIVITPAQIDAAEGGVFFPLTASAYAPLFGTRTGRYWRLLARQVSSSQDPVTVNATLAGILANYQIDTTQLFGLSAGNPLPSALVLDAAEQKNIKDATTAFNDIIKAQAAAKGLALWDAYSYFNSIKTGFVKNGVAYSPSFITGNLFSLDGVHLTPRGNAIAANEIINAINAKYGSNVPQVDETQFRAVLLP